MKLFQRRKSDADFSEQQHDDMEPPPAAGEAEEQRKKEKRTSFSWLRRSQQSLSSTDRPPQPQESVLKAVDDSALHQQQQQQTSGQQLDHSADKVGSESFGSAKLSRQASLPDTSQLSEMQQITDAASESEEAINVLKIFSGNNDFKATYKTVAVTQTTTVHEVIQMALVRFRVVQAGPNRKEQPMPLSSSAVDQQQQQSNDANKITLQSKASAAATVQRMLDQEPTGSTALTQHQFYLTVVHGESKEKELQGHETILDILVDLQSKDYRPGVGSSSKELMKQMKHINARGRVSSIRSPNESEIKFLLNKRSQDTDSPQQDQQLWRVYYFGDPLLATTHQLGVCKTISVRAATKGSDVIQQALSKFIARGVKISTGDVILVRVDEVELELVRSKVAAEVEGEHTFVFQLLRELLSSVQANALFDPTETVTSFETTSSSNGSNNASSSRCMLLAPKSLLMEPEEASTVKSEEAAIGKSLEKVETPAVVKDKELDFSSKQEQNNVTLSIVKDEDLNGNLSAGPMIRTEVLVDVVDAEMEGIKITTSSSEQQLTGTTPIPNPSFISTNNLLPSIKISNSAYSIDLYKNGKTAVDFSDSSIAAMNAAAPVTLEVQKEQTNSSETAKLSAAPNEPNSGTHSIDTEPQSELISKTDKTLQEGLLSPITAKKQVDSPKGGSRKSHDIANIDMPIETVVAPTSGLSEASTSSDLYASEDSSGANSIRTTSPVLERPPSLSDQSAKQPVLAPRRGSGGGLKPTMALLERNSFNALPEDHVLDASDFSMLKSSPSSDFRPIENPTPAIKSILKKQSSFLSDSTSSASLMSGTGTQTSNSAALLSYDSGSKQSIKSGKKNNLDIPAAATIETSADTSTSNTSLPWNSSIASTSSSKVAPSLLSIESISNGGASGGQSDSRMGSNRSIQSRGGVTRASESQFRRRRSASSTASSSQNYLTSSSNDKFTLQDDERRSPASSPRISRTPSKTYTEVQAPEKDRGPAIVQARKT